LTEGFAVAMGQQMPYDAQGNLLGNTLMDYFLPTFVETPHWETDHTVTPSPHHPLGAKGVAESPHVGSIPTFTSAVVDAFSHLGVTHLDMPHNAFRTWKALREHGAIFVIGISMEVKLDKQYPLDVDSARAWALLTDLKAVASCMPGAEITEQLSETSYKGRRQSQSGPSCGPVWWHGGCDREPWPASEKWSCVARVADKGGSSASMDLTAVITADPANPAHCVLNGQAAVIVNGKFAQFGGRMMVQVSDMLLAQFVENFRQTALTLPTAGGTVEGSAIQADAAPLSASGSNPAAAPVVAREINGLAHFLGLGQGMVQRLVRQKGLSMKTPGPAELPASQERLLRERLQVSGYLADEDLSIYCVASLCIAASFVD